MGFTLLPKSRGAWLRFGLSCSALISIGIYFHAFTLLALFVYHPKEGDIVFQSLPRGELADAIEGITQSPWSHCGIIMRKDGSWIVVEAIGEVRETPLRLWLIRGRRGAFEAYRTRAHQTLNMDQLRAALSEKMGRPYDYSYAPGDAEIYCSELVWKAYDAAFGLKLGAWQRLGELDWRQHEAFIREMEGGKLPLERPMITPVGLTRCTDLDRLWP